MKIIDIGLDYFDEGSNQLEVFVLVVDDQGNETKRRLSDLVLLPDQPLPKL